MAPLIEIQRIKSTFLTDYRFGIFTQPRDFWETGVRQGFTV